jgi:hypothetical protein
MRAQDTRLLASRIVVAVLTFELVGAGAADERVGRVIAPGSKKLRSCSCNPARLAPSRQEFQNGCWNNAESFRRWSGF